MLNTLRCALYNLLCENYQRRKASWYPVVLSLCLWLSLPQPPLLCWAQSDPIQARYRSGCATLRNGSNSLPRSTFPKTSARRPYFDHAISPYSCAPHGGVKVPQPARPEPSLASDNRILSIRCSRARRSEGVFQWMTPISPTKAARWARARTPGTSIEVAAEERTVSATTVGSRHLRNPVSRFYAAQVRSASRPGGCLTRGRPWWSTIRRRYALRQRRASHLAHAMNFLASASSAEKGTQTEDYGL